MNNKIGILTLFYNNNNYGAMLQAYALQRVLTKKNVDNEVINFDYSNKTYSMKKDFLKSIEGVFPKLLFLANRMMNVFERVLLYGHNKKINKKIAVRAKAFENFRLNYINQSKYTYDKNNIEESNSIYTGFICGSDQVWKPGIGQLTKEFWLNFVDKGKKKIAYAPSLGNSYLNAKQRTDATNLLSSFDAISVREKDGQNVLEGISSQKVHLVLDPTLLLSVDEWDSFCGDRLIKEPYVFAYILGENITQRKAIKTFADSKGLQVVFYPFIHGDFRFCDVNMGDIRIFDAMPQDFVNHIKNAEYVLTDSFHGCVFSIIYHKKFTVFLREDSTTINSINSRIYSLLDLLCVDTSVIKINCETNLTILDINYLPMEKALEKYRDYSISYLCKALS